MTIALATPTAIARGPLTHDDALALTAAIRESANRLWMLVAVAYERKAWRALGYPSWDDYVATELRISKSRSYQLVDTGRVMLTIAEAAGVNPETIDPVPARTVAKVKGSLPALKRAVRNALREAEASGDYVELDEVIATALEVVRGQNVDTRTVTRARTVTAVECPVCEGSGYLGAGKPAQELAERARRWLTRLGR